MEYVNKAEISGTIAEIRKTEKGSCFVMVRQIVTVNETDYPRLFEVYVDLKYTEIINILVLGMEILFTGTLSVFRIKGTKFHKIIIAANFAKILDK